MSEGGPPAAYGYADHVLRLLDAGEVRLGYDEDGNAVLFYTPDGDSSRAMAVAKLIPCTPLLLVQPAEEIES